MVGILTSIHPNHCQNPMSTGETRRSITTIDSTISVSVEAHETTLLLGAAGHRSRSLMVSGLCWEMLQYTLCIATLLTSFGTLITGLAAEKK